jgi:hypothetical protein
MIKKVVYIGYQPLTEKVMEDFFMINFINDGVEVEYWDMTEIYFPNIVFSNRLYDRRIIKISKVSLLEELLYNYKTENYICFVNFPYEWLVKDVFRLLKIYNVKTGIIARGMLPLPSMSHSLSLNSILSKLKFNKILRFGKNKFALILKRIGLIKCFDIVFFTGSESLQILGIGFEIDIKSAELVSINSSDYDRCLVEKSSSKKTSERYVLFLDEYLPFHPDFEMLGIRTLDSLKYYSSLNSFFRKIENEYDLKIIIAGHPKAELYKRQDFFEEREVFFGKTVELVKDCEFVIAHMSTSIGYSVVFDKKIILTYTNDLFRVMWPQFNIIKYFSKTLDTPFINIDDYLIADVEKEIDKESYNNFIYNYMTSRGNENVKSYSLVKKHLSI